MAVDDVSQYRQRLVGSLLVLLDNSVVSINKSDNVLQRKNGNQTICTLACKPNYPANTEDHTNVRLGTLVNSVRWFNKTNGL